MEFRISSSLLSSHLQQVNKVISSKNTLPILNYLLFSIQGDQLSIKASDTEIIVNSHLELISASEDCQFAIDAKMIVEPLKEFPEQPIRFKVDTSTWEIIMYSEHGEYTLVGNSGDEFPIEKPLDENNKNSFIISNKSLLAALNYCVFAIGNDELRPVMNGTYFDLGSEKSCFVSSDGHKLVKYTLDNLTIENPDAFILPKKPASLLKNILDKTDEEVMVEFNKQYAQFTLSNYTLSCRLIEGKFPNYNSVIPQNNTNIVRIDKMLLLNTLKQVSPFANQGSNLVKLHIENNSITISAQDIDFSTSAVEIIICEYDGMTIDIGFKSSLLIEMLNNLSSNEVIIRLADQVRAGLFEPIFEDSENSKEHLLMLLMPMSLGY